MMLSSDLEGKTVFLSASYPEPGINWPKEYRDSLNPGLIAQGVKAFLKAIFMRRGKVVFGGHPTITPFVIDVAEGFGKYYEDEPFVYFYQSKYFEEKYPEDAKALQAKPFAIFRATEAVSVGAANGTSQARIDKSNREASLLAMRQAMFVECNPAFAVFIGGKEGIVHEFDIFHQHCPKGRLYPIMATGGAASRLLASDGELSRIKELREVGIDDNMLQALRSSKGMPFIFDKIIRDYLNAQM
jgi:SLOG cluster3 family